MRVRRLRDGLMALLAAGLLAAAPVYALEVILTNNEKIEGELVSENPRSVTIRTLTQTITVPRTRIREIRDSAPGYMEVVRVNDALRRNELAKVSALIDAASAAGAPATTVAELREELRKKETARELAKYSAIIEAARRSASAGQDSDSLTEIRNLIATMDASNPSRSELISILVSYHLTRADDHRDRVRNKEAIDELRKAIELDPSLPEAYMQLAEIQKTTTATWNDAIANFSRAIALNKDRLAPDAIARIHWEMGEIFRQQIKWKEAATSYRSAHQLSPQSNIRLPDRLIEAMRAYTQELLNTNQNAMALMVTDAALEVRKDVDILVLRGRVLAGLKRYDESTEVLKEVLELNPRIRDVAFLIAQNYESEGETLAAREFLEREISINTQNYEALCQLGDYALMRDDFAIAEGFYTRARNADSDRPRAALGLAQTCRRMERYTDALRYVDEVLTRIPEDRQANLEKGRIFLDQENLEEARNYFSKVLELIEATPKEELETLKELHADALIARGEIGLLTAGPGTANQDFRKALEVQPDYPYAYFAIGNAYKRKFDSSKRLDDLKEAEKNLMRARELEPKNPQYALELGILYKEHLARADAPNERDYFQKAIVNWKSYIDLGGANAAGVESWIREIGS